MALIVQKYGGKSMGTIEKIQGIARDVLKLKAKGHQLVIVVSAMEGQTDRLIDLALGITDLPDLREYDSLISSGEQVSSALLAIALQQQGSGAISLLAHQIPIHTNETYKDARIKTRYERILDDRRGTQHD